MLRASLAALPLVMVSAGNPALADPGPCRSLQHRAVTHIVCTVDPRTVDVALAWQDAHGAPLGSLTALERSLIAEGRRPLMLMNAGMYHADLAPVGLLVVGRRTLGSLVRGRGPGNFHMLPNGVFFVGPAGTDVRETENFRRTRPTVVHATQSGPMLVIDGRLHPRFREDSPSLKYRNGVGVLPDGRLVFALSEAPVTFHDFATLFRDALGARRALYLDGSVSSLLAPGFRRLGWRPLGPMIAVTARP